MRENVKGRERNIKVGGERKETERGRRKK
jgi:hypothetical protein